MSLHAISSPRIARPALSWRFARTVWCPASSSPHGFSRKVDPELDVEILIAGRQPGGCRSLADPGEGLRALDSNRRAHGTQFPPAPQRRGHAHRALRRAGERHPHPDPRHPQDDSRIPAAGKTGGARRRRHQPPARPLRPGDGQGQPPRRGRRTGSDPGGDPTTEIRQTRTSKWSWKPTTSIRSATFLELDGVDHILLDNMSLEELREAVILRGERGKPQLEASGGVTLETLRGNRRDRRGFHLGGRPHPLRSGARHRPGFRTDLNFQWTARISTPPPRIFPIHSACWSGNRWNPPMTNSASLAQAGAAGRTGPSRRATNRRSRSARSGVVFPGRRIARIFHPAPPGGTESRCGRGSHSPPDLRWRRRSNPSGSQAGIKWPNDVWIGQRKVAGILVEAGADFAVIGIGLNVNTTGFPARSGGNRDLAPHRKLAELFPRRRACGDHPQVRHAPAPDRSGLRRADFRRPPALRAHRKTGFPDHRQRPANGHRRGHRRRRRVAAAHGRPESSDLIQADEVRMLPDLEIPDIHFGQFRARVLHETEPNSAAVLHLSSSSSCGLLNKAGKPTTKNPKPVVEGPKLVGRIASIPADKRFVLIQSYGKWKIESGRILTTRGPRRTHRQPARRPVKHSANSPPPTSNPAPSKSATRSIPSMFPSPPRLRQPAETLQLPENPANPPSENVQKNN